MGSGGNVGRATDPSQVRIHQAPTPKTPRNRVNFSVDAWMIRGSLCPRRLNGGAKGIRTCTSVLQRRVARRPGGSTANPNRPTWRRAIEVQVGVAPADSNDTMYI